MLTIHPVHAFNDNFIWSIENSSTQKAVIVDPGDGALVQRYLESKKLQLEAILVTHHHPDHTGGLSLLRNRYACDVIGFTEANYHGVTHALKDGDSFSALNCTFNVITVPGHTLDHIAFFSDKQSSHTKPWLFCGDTLFSGGCGRLFEGSAEQMQQSLAKLCTLPSETLVFCAHEYTLANLSFARIVEPNNIALADYEAHCKRLRDEALDTIPTTLSNELAINPFLRTSSSHEVRAFAMQQPLNPEQAKPIDLNEAEIFRRLRLAKDHF